MKFTGIGTWLQNRISLQIPYMYRAGESAEMLQFVFHLAFVFWAMQQESKLVNYELPFYITVCCSHLVPLLKPYSPWLLKDFEH